MPYFNAHRYLIITGVGVGLGVGVNIGLNENGGRDLIGGSEYTGGGKVAVGGGVVVVGVCVVWEGVREGLGVFFTPLGMTITYSSYRLKASASVSLGTKSLLNTSSSFSSNKALINTFSPDHEYELIMSPLKSTY